MPASPLYDERRRRPAARARSRRVARRARAVTRALSAAAPVRGGSSSAGRCGRGQMEETLLPKSLALPIFASDPLSSVAYATEVGARRPARRQRPRRRISSSRSRSRSPRCSRSSSSRTRQTVRVYETSGGAYIVARENLGTLPSLVGAAALLTDYVLTVAVSVSAGIFAITSFAPSLAGHKVGALARLPRADRARQPARCARVGARSSRCRRISFVTAIGVLVVAGLVELATGHAHRARSTPHPLPVGTGAITLFVAPARVLVRLDRADRRRGDRERRQRVPAPARQERGADARDPRRRSRSSLFLGVSYLAVHLHARPSSTDSVVSQIARAVFPAGIAAAASCTTSCRC